MKVDVIEANHQPGETEMHEDEVVDEKKSADDVFAELAALLQPHTAFSVGPDNVVEAVKQLVHQQSRKLEQGSFAEVAEKGVNGQACVHLHIRPDDDCWYDVLQAAAKKCKVTGGDSSVEKSKPSMKVTIPAGCKNSPSVTSNTANSNPASSKKTDSALSTAGSRVFSDKWRESWKVGSRVELFMDRTPYAKLAGTLTRAYFASDKDMYDIKLDNGDEVRSVNSVWLSTLN